MMRKAMPAGRQGFTIAELVVGVMVFAFVAIAGVMLLNPKGQLARGNDSKRYSHVNAILNAIRQNTIDNRSGFSCAAGAIPTTIKRMASGAGTSTYDIAPCIVPVYLEKMPYDPTVSGAHFGGVTDYDSGYSVVRNASSGQITVSAPFAEAKAITVTR